MNKISIILLFLLSGLVANAQVGKRRSDWSVGITGGYIMNKVDFQPYKVKQSLKGAPMFGFATRYICEKYFTCIAGVQGEVNYTNLGWKEKIDDGSGNTYSRDVHYISIPMLMQMGWGREVKGFKFVFMAGPQLGICLGTTEHRGGGEWKGDSRNVNYQYNHDIDNKFDYGIAAGAGLEYSSKIGHFILEGRFYYGLGDMYDNSKRGYFGRSANQTIYAKLTYLFDVHKTKNCIRK